MTWVIGAALSRGYAVLISDVRVTFGTGKIADELQKVHHVGNVLLAGSSGSVEFAMAAIDSMKAQYSAVLSNDFNWDSKVAAERWKRVGRRIMSHMPTHVQAMNTESLLAGCKPDNTSSGRPEATLIRLCRGSG